MQKKIPFFGILIIFKLSEKSYRNVETKKKNWENNCRYSYEEGYDKILNFEIELQSKGYKGLFKMIHLYLNAYGMGTICGTLWQYIKWKGKF